jgi:3D (Asp-Asp-Asp) domain-containing protein
MNRQLLTFGLSLVVAGCAQNPQKQNALTGFSKENNRRVRKIRTTAYSPGEGGSGGAKSAIDTHLRSGELTSAAADWSRFPFGTKFRVVENNQTYIIEDYGSALVSTSTVDLFMPSHRRMRAWGVRYVTIGLLERGSSDQSLSILRRRQGSAYVRRMVTDLQRKNYPSEAP